MSKPNYRAILSFDAERKVFQAKAPELEHCSGEGATRAEACAKLEEEIDAQLANMLSHGSTPPRSVDEEDFSGEVSGKVSKALHRELAYVARSEGIEIAQLVAEMLAAGVEARRGTRGGQRSAPRVDGNRSDGNRADHNGNGNANGNSNGNRGGGRGTGFLDDRANFIEYVRTLDQNQSQPTVQAHHRGAPSHGAQRNHGGGGDANRGGQQRRRGGGGAGHQGHQGGQNRGERHGHNPGRQAAAPPPAAPPAHDGGPRHNQDE